MGPDQDASHFAVVHMDRDNLRSEGVFTEYDIVSYHDRLRGQSGAKWLQGGYLEQRDLYTSALFGDANDPNTIRNIHLGVDIWGPSESPVYAPIDGFIHSFAYNNKALDYGYTLILEHVVNGEQLHTLYGHLGKNYWNQWERGRKIKAGDLIANLGNKQENGGWIPHLHFQLVKDMEGKQGDYPGVCSASRLGFYKANCPDPNLLIKPS